MIEYVAGLLFSDQGDRVALIRKNRPEWQNGLLNGVGGKIEANESPIQAMNREFMEEAGSKVNWSFAFCLGNSFYRVHFYTAKSSAALENLKSQTDEEISIFSTLQLPENLIPNLKWIIPLILDQAIRKPIFFEDISG